MIEMVVEIVVHVMTRTGYYAHDIPADGDTTSFGGIFDGIE